MFTHVALAADVTQHISGLQDHPDLPMPGAGRIIIAVLVTLALALGSLVLAQRYLPKLLRSPEFAGHNIKVLARAPISRSVTAHLVQVDTQRVLVVEGRAGIELTVLPAAVNSESQPRP